MKYKNHFNLFRLLFLVSSLIGCVNMNNQQTHLLIGEWYGEIPETSAYLILKKNGLGSINYSEFKKKYDFKYSIKNDSIISIINNSKNSQYNYLINNNRLKLLPLKTNEETIDIISEFEFMKEDNGEK